MLAPAVFAPHRYLGVLLSAMFAAAVIAACSGPGEGAADRPLGQGLYVPATWQTSRDVPGHRIHVVENKIPCAACHDLSEQELRPPSPERCAVCHAQQAKVQHAQEQAEARFGPGARADCTACHVFTMSGGAAAVDGGLHATPSADDCRRCHGMQHGDATAVVVHASSDCLECHRPHSDRLPEPHACDKCHEDVHTQHAAQGRNPTEVCTTCHENQHGTSEEALAVCAPCHATQEPKVPEAALFEGGHRQCVGCHRPHEFDKGSAVACAECHEGTPVLGGRRVRAHNDCKSCHEPHDVQQSPEAACKRCHTGVHSDHPTRGVAGTCVGCHDPHPPPGASARARACSSCHQIAGSDAAFHGSTACRACHQPHAFVEAARGLGLCSQCHAEQIAHTSNAPGHRDCQSCHRGLPHRPGRLEAACRTCHAEAHAAAHVGHTQCRNCHEPHGGTVEQACRACHKEEHRSAPEGHQNCQSCHDAHSGSHQLAACGGCHARQASTPHGRLGSDCASCHRPHGPRGVARPPGCTTCHQIGKLPGLHALSKHQRCNQCHSAHGEQSDASRPTCLSCHRDRRDHYPEAPSCGSCHLFGAAR